MTKQDKLDRIEAFVYGAIASLILVGSFNLCSYLSHHLSIVWTP